MSKYCEYCSHSLDNSFNCLPCIHLEPRPYADNTVVFEDLFIAMGKIKDKDIDLHIDRETLLQEYIPKAQYEQRLKADMVAMLEELDLKIDEMYEPQFSKEGMDGFYWAQGLFKDLVQEKINALRGTDNES